MHFRQNMKFNVNCVICARQDYFRYWLITVHRLFYIVRPLYANTLLLYKFFFMYLKHIFNVVTLS